MNIAGIEMSVPTDEETQQSAEDIVETIYREFGIEGLRELDGGYPEVPKGPGLFALTAPDGITVKVVSQGMSFYELRDIVRGDVIRRLMRDFFAQGMAGGKTLDQLTVLGLPKVMHLKRQYRLEKLGG